jgi:mono/diheme cytochrome c family protein
MRRSKLMVAVAVATVLLAGCGGSNPGPSGSDPGVASAADHLREGRSVYADTCSVCHGNRGQGGIGPSLASVVETWPACRDHIEWISLGSEGWRAAHGDAYGAPGRPLAGGMPGQTELTPEEMRLVAAFERVEYGGQGPDDALADCGVVEPDAATG